LRFWPQPSAGLEICSNDPFAQITNLMETSCGHDIFSSIGLCWSETSQAAFFPKKKRLLGVDAVPDLRL
jgi:hypothetical protein